MEEYDIVVLDLAAADVADFVVVAAALVGIVPVVYEEALVDAVDILAGKLFVVLPIA